MRTTLIVGLGLIGGSAGMALRQRGWRVAYLDPNVAHEEVVAKGAADERVERIDDVSVDVIVFATSVGNAVDYLQSLETNAVVTSTCSVMRALRDAARGTFIAGHPMAGSHLSGLAAAKADLFEEQPTWFVDADHPLVDRLVRDCGAVPELVDAAEHDAALALTSHLPQVLSTALAAYFHGREDLFRFSGGGLRTFLRLARSGADMWESILDANRDQIAPHADAIAALVKQIIEGDPRDAFAKAQAVWEALEPPPR